MGLLNRGRIWLADKIQTAAGETVSYTRGADTIPVTGAVGLTREKSDRTAGAWVVVGDRDYLIPVAALAALGVPAIGDRITHTVGGVVMVFEVMPSETEPSGVAWRYSDPDHVTYRITVQRVG